MNTLPTKIHGQSATPPNFMKARFVPFICGYKDSKSEQLEIGVYCTYCGAPTKLEQLYRVCSLAANKSDHKYNCLAGASFFEHMIENSIINPEAILQLVQAFPNERIKQTLPAQSFLYVPHQRYAQSALVPAHYRLQDVGDNSPCPSDKINLLIYVFPVCSGTVNEQQCNTTVYGHQNNQAWNNHNSIFFGCARTQKRLNNQSDTCSNGKRTTLDELIMYFNDTDKDNTYKVWYQNKGPISQFFKIYDMQKVKDIEIASKNGVKTTGITMKADVDDMIL